MPNDRLSRWKEPIELLTFLSGDDKAQLEAVSKIQVAALADKPKDGVEITSSDMIRACRELIFDMRDGLPIFHAIMSSIDTDRIAIKAFEAAGKPR